MLSAAWNSDIGWVNIEVVICSVVFVAARQMGEKNLFIHFLRYCGVFFLFFLSGEEDEIEKVLS